MNKKTIYFIITVCVIYLVGYYTHDYIIRASEIKLLFSLNNIYFFHAVSAIIVYLLSVLVLRIAPSQVGYSYLASVFIKFGVFALAFKNLVFEDIKLGRPEKFSLVIPLFLFLIIEAVGVFKLINNVDTNKE